MGRSLRLKRIAGVIVVLGLCLLSCGNSPEEAQSELTYTNPIGGITGIGDPCMLKHRDRYYLYATSGPDTGYRVWESTNMVDWEPRGFALSRFHPENNWGRKSFWAPEVLYYQDRFYMVYSARAADGHLKIAIASSEGPLGPFVNVKAPLFDRGMSFIDGHIFIEDGTPYLYYVKDCSENIIDGDHVSQIFVQQLKPDMTGLTGEPVLVTEPSQAWEDTTAEWQWNEGPYVLKHNGQYYLTYSANGYFSPNYAVGYATAADPLGPWRKYEKNPILAKDLSIGVSGPGHNTFVRSPDDSELFIVYHAHTDTANPGGNRNVNIDRAVFVNGRLIIEGPTRSSQPAPSGAGR